MKYIIFITLLFFLTVGLHAQTDPVSISATNASVKDVFAEVQQKSGYRILYNDEIVPDELRVTVNAENRPVKEVLDALLQNTGLIFVMPSDELIIITKSEYVQDEQEIFGTVTDENDEPVPYANVVLYLANDTAQFGYGAVTGYDGYYKLSGVEPGDYRLRISFIGYKTAYTDLSVPADSREPLIRNLKLEKNITLLEELVVEGEHPVMKVEREKIIYHIPSLLKNKPVTNAYEAIREIPGVMEQQGVLALIGTNGMTILLNGQKTSMSYEQLMETLRGIPVSRIENIEVMYSAPPQYNVRGAAINVVLKQAADENIEQGIWQGEVAGEYRQRSYTDGNGRVNLLYLGKRTSVDASYSYRNSKRFNSEDLTAEHTLHGTVHDIVQYSEGTTKGGSHNTRLALQHTFSNKDKVDIAYTGIFDDTKSDRIASTDISGEVTDMKMGLDGPSSTHNIKADYTGHFGLNIGADYTSFHDESDYFLQNSFRSSSVPAEEMTYQSRQKIDRIMLYANRSHPLKNNWNLNYGLNYSGVRAKNRSDALKDGAEYDEATFDTRQQEHIWNFFAGFSKSFTERLSVQASIAAEYYNAEEISGGTKKELWNNVAWFPTVNISYRPAQEHIFQFAVSSDKEYPSYWSLSPNIFYFSAYGVTYGNPYLRPMRDYSVGLTYIFRQKYVIRPYMNYTPGYFAQLPYQSPHELRQEFMEQNYTYRRNIGLLTVIPFNIGRRISSRFVANGMYWREKDDAFFDISFDRKTVVGIFQMNHDISLASKPDLKMNVSGYISTPGAIQGIYDLGVSGNLSTALTWTFHKDRARLILKADDIFNTRIPAASVNYKGQKSTLKAFQDTRTVSLSFVYRFGGYKETERKEVDTSRFGGL
ncbi:outer membrane beta-barrel protein [uncultured Proteiniphilum sp.]|uniref:outer membrane beta-barrel protein n=1 Tax=uncultured Proteiniphilum sp. TaxID=497637 RepID=UPI002634405A|nr:outer membrane beta-barrel protein [uncultured Proteiniphilum sp.]